MGFSRASVWPLLRSGVVPAALLGLVACACAWSLRAVWPFTIDDAGISYAYAKHIAEGHGPTAVVGGAWVEGYSNPLWVLLLVPLHWLGLALPTAAKVLGAVFFVGSLLAAQRYFALLDPRGGRRPGALDVFFALALAGCLEFIVWVPAGLENALFSALLLSLGYLDARESLEPGRGGASGALAFALCVTRPEGALYAAPILAIKLVHALRSRAYARQAASFAAYWLLPWLAYQTLHYAVFRQLLPNTYYAKPGSSDWAEGSAYLLSNLKSSGMLYALPLALLGAIGQLRQKLCWLWDCLAGALFVIYSGGDWMPHARFLALFSPALAVLAALGVRNLARFTLRRAQGRVPSGLVLWGAALGLSALWWDLQVPRLRTLEAKPWCHFCERVSQTQRIVRLGRQAGLPSASLLTQDFGGPAWLSDESFQPIDFLGLCDQGLALIKRDRRRLGGSIGQDFRLYQAAIHERPAPPSWLYLPRNFWPGFGLSPEYRWSYLRLDPALLPRGRRDAFFGLHRGELVDYFPPLERFEFRSLSEHLTLVGVAHFGTAAAAAPEPRALAGAALRTLVMLVPRAKLRGTERLKLRVEAGDQSVESSAQFVARDLPGVAEQLSVEDPLRFEFRVSLPQAAASSYRVSLGVDSNPDTRQRDARRREAAGDWSWVPLGELPNGQALPQYARTLPRYPAALPAPLEPELRQLRPRVTLELELRREQGNSSSPDAELVRQLRALGPLLEARGQPTQAYLAYIWATQLDTRVWRDVGREVFRLRPPGGDDRFPLELALLGRYYASGADADLARLVGFYLSNSELLEAQYFLTRVPASAAGSEPFVTFSAELASSLVATLPATNDQALGAVARDPFGGALDFEAASLPGWEGVAPSFVAGSGGPHRSEPGLWGQHGQGLLSSLGEGPRGRGELLSPEFSLEGSLLSLLVGGGKRSRRVGVDLLVEGRVVESAGGLDANFLYPVFWDVSAYQGQRGRLRVLDDNVSNSVLLDRVLLWR